MAKTTEKTKKKEKRNVQSGVAIIQSTFNNTIISLTDEEGKVLGQGSPAMVGFKGARRSTAFAATKAAMDVAERVIKKYGLREVRVFVKGPGSGRNAAVKGLDSAGLRITMLADRTPIPHNGCRPRKTPRK
ncbi:MAG: 30S ribosomal protein S11 [Candidatus Dojkabacteria bacterium]|jgi:small subunit ribosomal protein S11|nr:30S ribosomal protein S11 [Candidatus Dojkabacteria bacterium]MDD4561284.1 30S ribosomal protein S11 [Candidatus Dojkabacteria bacterium]NLB11817.1 30S ribosomal protein S11 [Candidatus Dojkabacteria bacterium]